MRLTLGLGLPAGKYPAESDFQIGATTEGTASLIFSLSSYLVAAYEGSPVVQLREDNGGTTKDFKLVGGALVTDDVSQDTVAAWLTANGATNAYASVLYDQLNNVDFVQATAAKQPLFVASGIGGKPCLQFDGTDDLLTGTWNQNVTPNAHIAIFGVVDPQGAPGGFMFSGPSAATAGVLLGNAEANFWLDNGVSVTGTLTDANPHVITWVHNDALGTNTYVNEDGASIGSGDNAINWSDGLHGIGGVGNGGTYCPFQLGALIVYDGVYSGADEDTIETGLAALFGL